MLIEEIANWKLEAKLEDNARYFFHSSEVKNIENGSKVFVIGRKGTGKTAIAQFILNKASHNNFSENLTFKNFPFSELYKFKNTIFQPHSQYVSIWKYIIYSCVCKMMIRNEGINGKCRNELEPLFGKKNIKNLRTEITSFVSAGINILGCGGEISLNKNVKDRLTIDDKVEILEDYVLENIDMCKYFIIFDELDEEYRELTDNNKQYSYLITGLLKAAQDIRSIVDKRNISIYPIVFLRDDIYDLIVDQDRTKWRDLQVSLRWDENKIKQLLAFRISRAAMPTCTPQSFNTAWQHVFCDRFIAMGNRQQKRIPIFDYISRSTLLRPRDYINYLQCCCKMCLDKGHAKITAATVKDSDKNFSEYLKQEFEDEIRPVLPNISDIFRQLSTMCKQTFGYTDFIDNFKSAPQAISQQNPDTILKWLFHFSVIGNMSSQSTAPAIFRYKNYGSWMNVRQPLVIHRGLFKSLQIV